jgi:hypothetical protein
VFPNRNDVLFQLEDLLGEPIPSQFYEHHLTHTVKDPLKTASFTYKKFSGKSEMGKPWAIF